MMVAAQVASVQAFRRRIRARLRDETSERVRRSAVVFAPHQDDEILGCGGTMILKCRASVPVSCVFMTDGRTSHQRFLDPADLCALRKREALDAAAVIGLAPGHVDFFDFPDGALASHREPAVERVVELLNGRRPEEVYVPYRRDGTPDHEATYRIVLEALRRIGSDIRILEYPVWLWNQWPWVPLTLEVSRAGWADIGRVARSRFGFELLRGFRCGVFVADVMAQKRLALEQHRSQMTRLMPETSWPTLEGVASGEFLGCFFQDYELFCCSTPD